MDSAQFIKYGFIQFSYSENELNSTIFNTYQKMIGGWNVDFVNPELTMQFIRKWLSNE